MLKTHMAACLFATALAAAPALAQSTAPGASGGTDRPTATGTGSEAAGSPSMRPGTSTETGSSGMGATSSGMGATGGMNSSSGSAPGSMSNSNSAASAGAPANPSSGTPMPNSGNNAAMSGTSMSGSSTNSASASGSFMAQPASGQFMASKLIGTSVMGQNNESIGDVNDVLMDRSGKAVAVLIGVGGFLGIGEKDVAVPFDRIEMTAGDSNGPATTGSTSTGSNSNTSASTNGAGTTATTGNSMPNRLMVKMSKQELESAPRFSMSGNRDGASSGGSDMNRPGASSTTGTSTRP